ncbi:hypothetical protein MJO28_014485 [Puccinia striiformis f. sp. tritici]|uniref:Uncharacterized protein n=1 Tax=Puccinia striiformis f. sp. tritici TaxID=168172 RepID=A0ACC0DUY0_9BASI|nr:hypothetical protein MJO28_014485 [Puccinia striiformis f. sp. tritici]
MIQAVQVDRVLALRNKRREVQKRRFLVFLVALAGLRRWSKLIHKEPYNDAIFGGDAYVKHMLSGNERRAQAMFRMSINVFEECSEELGAIDHEPASKLLSMDEQFAIFLYVVGQNATNRQTQDRFQHSGETISKVFHHIIYLILQLRSKYIVAPDPKYTHEVILDSPKFSPFFDHCLGAMDGCHVPACVPEHLAGPYRNREGMLAQNVLGVVDFDMKFTYLMVRWEGSAHDSKVLGSALSEDFRIPQHSFYLADAGYALTRGTLVPYCGVRYHLRENAQAGKRPETKEELFNLCHSMMRNVVERTFGTWKKRFPILVHPLEYSLNTQRDLVLALAILHNMIIEHTCEPTGFLIDPDEDGAPTGEDDLPPEAEEEPTLSQRRERARNNAWRDQMAQDMWTQYQDYLQSLRTL